MNRQGSLEAECDKEMPAAVSDQAMMFGSICLAS